MVNQLTYNPKFKGSNPAPGYRRDKIAKQCFLRIIFSDSTVVKQLTNNPKIGVPNPVVAAGAIKLQNNDQTID
jgi:hypothetical protein